jgi:hypothetical protein
MNKEQLLVDVLHFIMAGDHGRAVGEFHIAKKFFEGRVLQARQVTQHLMWTGIIVPHGIGYVLSPMAMETYRAALELSKPATPAQPVRKIIISRK